MACLADTPADVIVFLLDDARFDQLDVLAETAARVAPQTVNFSRAYVTEPLCCPERASFLSGGWYPHQTTVITNQAPDGGASRFLDMDTLPVRLQAAGYQTALVGKYLNEMSSLGDYVPPGWTLWAATPEGEGWNHYGVWTGSSTPEAPSVATVVAVDQYVTDWQAREAVAFVRAHADEPKFLYLSFLAPHHPHTPAPEDTTAFADFAYRERAYQEADVSDKPAWIGALPLFTEEERASADLANRERLQTLLAVDRAMARVIDAVAATDRADQTLFVVASDNGQMWGEHRLVGKGVAYEESTRVPLWLAHADLSAREEPALVAMNLDLAATVSALAGLEPTGVGQSLVALACGETETGRDTVLLQGWPGDVPSWSGMVTERWKYIETAEDLSELYDLDADPFEEQNVRADTRYQTTVESLSSQLAAQRGLAIVSEALDAATVGTAVDVTLQSWGGEAPLHWAVTEGSLPAGVALSDDGVLSGTPTEAGTVGFRLALTDSGESPYTGGAQAHSRAYTWEIAAAESGDPKVRGCGCAVMGERGSPWILASLLGMGRTLARRRRGIAPPPDIRRPR